MAMPQADTITFCLPKELSQRTKKFSKQNRISISQVLRDALKLYFDQIEAKELAQIKAKEELENLKKRKPRGIKPIVPLDERAPFQEEKVEYTDRLTPIYQAYAEKIAKVLNQPMRVLALQHEACDAIRKAAPLTAPRLDQPILERLEEHLVKMGATPTVLPQENPTEPDDELPSALKKILHNAEMAGRLAPSKFQPIHRPTTEEDPLIGRTLANTAARIIEDEEERQIQQLEQLQQEQTKETP